MPSNIIGRKRARDEEETQQPQPMDCKVDKEHEIQLQHTVQLYSECANAVDRLDEGEGRKVVRNAISKLLNLGSRTMGEMLQFLVGGGVPTHEVAAAFCESTAEVPVVLERHMTNKNASQQWLTTAVDAIGQIVAIAQSNSGLPAALMGPRLISARVALLEERDRDGTEYLSKMKELVTQVKPQEGPQDVGEALVQLAGYFMRDFRLCTRLEELGAAPPRSEEQWRIFSECGKVLDEWTRKACKTFPRPELPTHLPRF